MRLIRIASRSILSLAVVQVRSDLDILVTKLDLQHQ